MDVESVMSIQLEESFAEAYKSENLLFTQNKNKTVARVIHTAKVVQQSEILGRRWRPSDRKRNAKSDWPVKLPASRLN